MAEKSCPGPGEGRIEIWKSMERVEKGYEKSLEAFQRSGNCMSGKVAVGFVVVLNNHTCVDPLPAQKCSPYIRNCGLDNMRC